MPSGSVRSEATSSMRLRRIRPPRCEQAAPAASMSAQRRQVAPGSLEQRAHVREIVGGIHGQTHVGPPQRRRRRQLDDVNRWALRRTYVVTCSRSSRRLVSRRCADERLGGDALDGGAVRQPLLADVVGRRDRSAASSTAAAPAMSTPGLSAGRADHGFEVEASAAATKRASTSSASPRNTAAPRRCATSASASSSRPVVVASTTGATPAMHQPAQAVLENRAAARSAPAPCPAGATIPCAPAE